VQCQVNNKAVTEHLSMIKTLRFQSPLGELIAGATDEGICLLEFNDRKRAVREQKELVRLLDQPLEEGLNDHLIKLQEELEEYFQGKRKVFSVSLVTPGTDFQKAVWKELLNIPFGTTRSYQEQADALKSPDAVRAVANANGMNRISIIIPCHRVIGSNGRLTGYGGGLGRKKWLLDHEKRYSGKAIEMELF
jgi:AraC family transcriptional regulator, regulatory protein of adaptative response / methylated-DNA-[protein]-cysteine methyltransferase